ncbi:putative nucleotidyltransferase substrate binding domain-containing protein [Geobacter sp. SVR]|uniref:putative nucleotidyltransferase substrate binding domain-containing protein n=1 Tax=Geobacter sp. SVR TaxID=2495594 RepID=UPI00143EF9DD|nr:putative nucleotidyltransferase substrate binding domain-containing protein [Geobacter sp. SVR]BCS54456.1 nucleotidyltransferase [Geobacter sp. SVR]GCF87055.1 nucleotidyltransferase [Geobacter sp. SVR]
MTFNDTLSAIPELHRITRYCEAEEVGLLLRDLRNVLEQDRRQMLAWSEEYEDLLARVQDADSGVLTSIHQDLNRVETERFLLSYSVTALHANCTHYRDLIAARTMTLVSAEMAAAGRQPPPVPCALLSMGSDGRQEQTLITDQDYLIVYGDGGGETADLYFKDFSDLLVDKLEEAGFKKCTGDIMPSNPTWRGSYSQWRKRLLAIVRYEFDDYAKNMMDLIVLSDARYVAGDRELAEQLAGMIRTMEQDYFQVLWGMAKAATEMRLALGFLKRLWTESSGEHKGEFNLKLLAWAPLVMNIRILAINQGIPATNTVERISLLEREGSFSASVAQELRTAYHILTKHRILLQIKVLKGIQNDAYHLNPYQLPAAEREKIRHGLIKIEELQKVIHSNFSIV